MAVTQRVPAEGGMGGGRIKFKKALAPKATKAMPTKMRTMITAIFMRTPFGDGDSMITPGALLRKRVCGGLQKKKEGRLDVSQPPRSFTSNFSCTSGITSLTAGTPTPRL